MSKITCQKCFMSFDLMDQDTKVTSYLCPRCGASNKPEPQIHATEYAPCITPIAPIDRTNLGTTVTPPPSSSPSERMMCEWEANWKSDTLNAYINTVKAIIKSPIQYFGTIKPFQDYTPLILFIFINGLITMLVSLAWQIPFSRLSNPSQAFGIPFMLCGAFFAPLIMVGFIFLVGLLLHFCFTSIGGSKKDFATTITVYGLSTATNLFGIIPILGSLASLAYTLIINIGGQAEAHKIPPSRAAIAFLIPGLIFCCCLGGLFFLIVGLGAGLHGH